MKKFSISELAMVKWSAITFTLFLVLVWPQFLAFVSKVHWSVFLVISLALAIKPTMKMFR